MFFREHHVDFPVEGVNNVDGVLPDVPRGVICNVLNQPLLILVNPDLDDNFVTDL